MGTERESLVENEEQKEDSRVEPPKTAAAESKPKEEDSFWGFAVKKWESLTDSSSDAAAEKKSDQEVDGKEEKEKEDSFWDSALKKWDEVKESIAPSNKNAEDDKDSWSGRNNEEEMETFWADDEAQLYSENKNFASRGNDPVYSNVMGIMSNAQVITDKRIQAVTDLVPYIDLKELLTALKKLNTGKSLKDLGVNHQTMLARHLQDSASQKIFEFSRLPPQQRAEKFKLYKQKCQPVCVLEQMSTLDRQKKEEKSTRKLIGSFPLTEIAIHGDHLLVRQSMEDLSNKEKRKTSFGFFSKDSKTDKKTKKPSKQKKSFKSKLSSWLK